MGSELTSRVLTTLAAIFPSELTALRAGGLVFAAGLLAFVIWRRRELSNGAVLLGILGALALAIVSGTELVDTVLEVFAFERGNGERILGLAVFAIAILFLLVLRALSVNARQGAQLQALLEGLAWEEFRSAGLPKLFVNKVAIVVPAYNEADNVASVIKLIPPQACGIDTAVLVVDDGSRDGTADVAAGAGAVVARHVINRGGGAALRTGYRLMSESGAKIVVTLDADGQHIPAEMERLVQPIVDGEVDMAHGSRVLGDADPNSRSRELGIVFFNKVVSFITRDEGLGLLERLPRRPHHRPPPARPAPGAVPHLRAHDRGDQAGHPGQGGADHGPEEAERALEEARRCPLRPRVHERDRSDLVAVVRGGRAPRVRPGRDVNSDGPGRPPPRAIPDGVSATRASA